MKTDLYIKIILTVIACMLTGLFLHSIGIIATANAQSGEITNVRIKSVDASAFMYSTVPVRIEETADVRVVGTADVRVEGTADVNVENASDFQR